MSELALAPALITQIVIPSVPLTAFSPVVSPIVGTVMGWFACAIVLTALCNRFLPWPTGCRDNSLIFTGLVLLMLLPIGDHPGLAAGLHGALGTPSGTLFQLSVLTCLNQPWPPLPARRRVVVIFVLMLGCYYALALGYGKEAIADPYEFGFAPGVLWLVLTIIAYALYRLQQTGWLVILSVNLIMWRTGLLPSRNVLDVMVDPTLIAVLLWHGIFSIRRQRETAARETPERVENSER